MILSARRERVETMNRSPTGVVMLVGALEAGAQECVGLSMAAAAVKMVVGRV